MAGYAAVSGVVAGCTYGLRVKCLIIDIVKTPTVAKPFFERNVIIET
jgi:hypothetical protein